jgi:hypothetical protein
VTPLRALLAACLVAIGGVWLPPLAVQETGPSLAAWTAEIPVAALALTSPVRSEKPLQAARASLKKPLGLARALPVWEHAPAAQPRTGPRHLRPALPRRSLPAAGMPSRAPGDPSH